MSSKRGSRVLWLLCLSLLSTGVCANQTEKAVVNSTPVIHVFVALADNVNQGIVPVPASLGNGDNPKTNLYWGAAFGVRTFFSRNKDWELISVTPNPSAAILERCIFKHRRTSILMVADAYRGKEISQTTLDFLEAAAGGSADLVAYVGHNGLMDFKLPAHPVRRDDRCFGPPI